MSAFKQQLMTHLQNDYGISFLYTNGDVHHCFITLIQWFLQLPPYYLIIDQAKKNRAIIQYPVIFYEYKYFKQYVHNTIIILSPRYLLWTYLLKKQKVQVKVNTYEEIQSKKIQFYLFTDTKKFLEYYNKKIFKFLIYDCGKEKYQNCKQCKSIQDMCDTLFVITDMYLFHVNLDHYIIFQPRKLFCCY